MADPAQRPPTSQQQQAAVPSPPTPPAASLEGRSPDEVAGLALSALQMRDNPNTRGLYLRLLKATNPSIAIPEVDVEVRTAAALAQRDKRIGEMEARETARAQRENAMTLYEVLRDDNLVGSRNDFSELVKYAHENGFHTTEQGLRRARSFQEQERKAAEPTPSISYRQIVPKDNKELMANPREWARKEASAAINEIMKTRGLASAK